MIVYIILIIGLLANSLLYTWQMLMMYQQWAVIWQSIPWDFAGREQGHWSPY